MKKLSNKKAKKAPVVHHLMIGLESTAMIDNLISGTKIKSEKKIAALHDYFVKGKPIGTAAALNELPQSNLSDCIDTLNEIAGVCQKFHEIKMHSKIYQK